MSPTKERPILMSAPMVRALLAGTKTQTRRVVKGRALEWLQPGMFKPEYVALPENNLCPYGVPGDRLWVREAWRACHDLNNTPPRDIPHGSSIEFEATKWSYAEIGIVGKLRPGMFMPRWASRITLEVTEVRVERLNSISEADAIAEGIARLNDGGYGLPAGEFYDAADPRQSYLGLFESINGPGSVEANPWVWVVAFKPLEQ